MTIRDLILNALALIGAIACLVKIWLTHTWESYLAELLLGFGGLVAFLFPYEFSSWQGYQAWRANQWRFQPEGWVRFTGAVMLGMCAFSVLVKQVAATNGIPWQSRGSKEAGGDDEVRAAHETTALYAAR